MPTTRRVIPPEERFQFLDDDELDKKLQPLQNSNTTKTDKKTEQKFINYLQKSFIA